MRLWTLFAEGMPEKFDYSELEHMALAPGPTGAQARVHRGGQSSASTEAFIAEDSARTIETKALHLEGRKAMHDPLSLFGRIRTRTPVPPSEGARARRRRW